MFYIRAYLHILLVYVHTQKEGSKVNWTVLSIVNEKYSRGTKEEAKNENQLLPLLFVVRHTNILWDVIAQEYSGDAMP